MSKTNKKRTIKGSRHRAVTDTESTDFQCTSFILPHPKPYSATPLLRNSATAQSDQFAETAPLSSLHSNSVAMANPRFPLSLKLLIDMKSHKVLFAEAGKDFVDFLFTLLSLPVGTIIRLLLEDGMVGTLSKLYESVETLSDTHMQPNLDKNTLLKPKPPIEVAGVLRLLAGDETTRKLYMCGSGNSHRYVADDPRTKCPSCRNLLSTEVSYVAPLAATGGGGSSSEGGGYVKGIVTYVVMDDLEVRPMSTISSITMLNKCNVKEVGALVEKVVQLGMQEGISLLKASLETNCALTSVFLGKKLEAE